ncbi:MAG: hypothetical protein K2M19_09335 [Muribaculaceae bacterium]|nr:hypothetical protein [Muribaculaceae bacterium]
MKHSLLFLLILLTALQSLNAAELTHTVNFDPDLVELKPDVSDSIPNPQQTFVKYATMTVKPYQNGALLPATEVKFSVPYNAYNFQLTAETGSIVSFELNAPIAISTEKDRTENTISPLIAIDNVGFLGGNNKVVTVSILPFSVDNQGSLLTLATSVSFTLSWDLWTQQSESLDIISPKSSYARALSLEELKAIVVNPEDATSNTAPIKSNYTTDQQDYEYIIITPARLSKSLERLAALRRLKGFGSKVYTLENIYSLFPNGDTTSGINDDAGKVREFIKYAYQNFGTRYVLLAGKYPEMPIRKFVKNNASAPSLYGQNTAHYPTDLYFGDLNAKWTYANDRECCTVEPDYYSEVYIGRIPFNNIEDVNNYIDKLIVYEFNPGNGDYTYLSKGIMTYQSENETMKYYTEDRRAPFFELFNNENGKLLSNYKGKNIIEYINKYPAVSIDFVGHGNPGSVGVGSLEKDAYGVLALEGEHWYHLPENSNGLDNLTNKWTPSWSHNISCSLIPPDTIKEAVFEKNPETNKSEFKKLRLFNVKKTFGDSYILGKDYGGVILIGNTRSSYTIDSEFFLYNFYKRLLYVYDTPSINPETIFAGQVNDYIRIPNSMIDIESHLMHNLWGDPLTEFRCGEPTIIKVISQSTGALSTNKLSATKNGTGWITSMPLSDRTYASKKSQSWYINRFQSLIPQDNVLSMIYGINTIPQILPLNIKNIRFDGSSTQYIFADKVYLGGTNTTSSSCEAIFANMSDLTIESLSNVQIKEGTRIESGGKLTINASQKVIIEDIRVDNYGILIINAPEIIYDEDDEPIFFQPLSTVILNGKKLNLPNRSKHHVSRSYDSIVTPGRVWWYQRAGNFTYGQAEYGLTIGEREEINGEEWYHIDLISLAYYDDYGMEITTKVDFNTPSDFPFWIREKDGLVEVRNVVDPSHFDEIALSATMFRDYNLEEGDSYTYTVYKFGQPGDRYFYGDDNYHYEFEISAVNDVETPSGLRKEYTNKRLDYKASKKDYPVDDYYLHGFRYIEGIGQVVDPDDYNMNNLFFLPMSHAVSMSGGMHYWLRYVTDEKHNIIYKGKGGLKLWEIDQLGVENVAITPSDSSTEFFSIQGHRVHSDTLAPGIYIRRQGSSISKVIIR